MIDKEILEKYIDLDKSCLRDAENIQVVDMLYKCKDAFSLRDEIGTCPNIEVEIDVTDKAPFLIRPYHVKEGDNTFTDKRDEKVRLFRNIKRRIFSLFLSCYAHKYEGYER